MALKKKPPFSICLQHLVDMTTRSFSNKARQQYEEIRQSAVDRKKRSQAAQAEQREKAAEAEASYVDNQRNIAVKSGAAAKCKPSYLLNSLLNSYHFSSFEENLSINPQVSYSSEDQKIELLCDFNFSIEQPDETVFLKFVIFE